jgi:hypothetical protein
MDAANTTFTSVLAHAKLGNVNIPPQVDYVIDAVSNASIWTILGTLFALAVLYDQGESWRIPCVSRDECADPSLFPQSATSCRRVLSSALP